MSNIDTLLVHPPHIPGEATGASSTPIYQTATFSVTADGSWDYSRSGNPTRDVLEQQLARLDGAACSLAYTSGMAAVAAVLRLAPPTSEIVVASDLYGGTMRFLGELAQERNLCIRFVDATNPGRVSAAVSPRTALVWLETPSNPRLQTSDVGTIAKVAHRAGALLAVDNSILSSFLQRPLADGADLAVQSATKVLGGHSDLTAGVVSVADPELGARLAFTQNAEGNALAPFESWLLLRGIETLGVRLRQQVANARRVAEALAAQASVRRLYTAPQCFVVSFEMLTAAIARRFADATKLFRKTVSFGGVASSVNLPSEMSHASVPEPWRTVQALSPGLVRLSIGIEDADHLVADLETALHQADAPSRALERRSAGLVKRPGKNTLAVKGIGR